jgi:hypothetical protein
MTDPIEQLLSETDMVGDKVLHDFLTELQQTGTSVRPMPSAELAALMTPISQRSTLRRRGAIITALIVVGTVGVGVTAAAASPEVRAATTQVFQSVIGTVLPGPGGVQTPHQINSRDATKAPAPSTTVSPDATTHPSPTNHPGASNHPGPSNHPGSGPSNSASSDASSNSSSGGSQPSNVPSAHPAVPRRGVSSTH